MHCFIKGSRNKKYDINNTITNENTYKNFVVKRQLFSILNENDNFCIKEKKILTCNKCNKDFSKFINYRSP